MSKQTRSERCPSEGGGGPANRRGNGTLRDSSEFTVRSILDVRTYVRHDAGFVTRSGFFEEPGANGAIGVFRVGGDSRVTQAGQEVVR